MLYKDYNFNIESSWPEVTWHEEKMNGTCNEKQTQTDTAEKKKKIYGLLSNDRSNDCVFLMLGPTHVGNSISWILAAAEHACAKFDLNICNSVQCWLCSFIFLLPLSFSPLPGFSKFISKKSTGTLHGGHHILPWFLMQFGRKKEQFK